MSTLPACVSVYPIYSQCLWWQEDGMRPTRGEGLNNCEPLCVADMQMDRTPVFLVYGVFFSCEDLRFLCLMCNEDNCCHQSNLRYLIRLVRLTYTYYTPDQLSREKQFLNLEKGSCRPFQSSEDKTEDLEAM